MIIAGIDVGNSTTEVCIGSADEEGYINFLSSAKSETTGTKGTSSNVKGIKNALNLALEKTDMGFHSIDIIRINEATPVIGGTAMETITETIITESTMIGHNPDTPAGEGVAVGTTRLINQISVEGMNENILAIVPEDYNYEEVANIINSTKANIVGIIVQKDEAVLIFNRLNTKVPVIDEVKRIDALPIGQLAAIEVAGIGNSVRLLSNPYGIAKVFDLNPDETRKIIPIAKSLIGKKSAVVVKSIEGGLKERAIKAGSLNIKLEDNQLSVINIDKGAKAIMDIVNSTDELEDVTAENGTNIGNMFNQMKESLTSISEEGINQLHIKDLLAINTFVHVNVRGALAGEVAMESAVAIAAMVKTNQLPMRKLADILEQQLRIPVKVAGVEAVMAVLGALTTKGTRLPLFILDLGGGSTDAALLDASGQVKSTHLAGAGAFVTMMINKELCLDNLNSAELIKRYPLGKINSLYHMTLENGEVVFFDKPVEAKLYARVVVVTDEELIPVQTDLSVEKIVMTRKEIKKKVFVTNALRALEKVTKDHNIRNISNVVLVGGSALDREIPELIQQELANYNIVAGRADIRGKLGPRNAVATGLVMSYVSEAF